MPVAFSCLIHSYSQRERKKKKQTQKALHSQVTALSSQFRRGHRKTTKTIINVKSSLHLKTGFHQKATRSQTENTIKRRVPQNQCRATREQLLKPH